MVFELNSLLNSTVWICSSLLEGNFAKACREIWVLTNLTTWLHQWWSTEILCRSYSVLIFYCTAIGTILLISHFWRTIDETNSTRVYFLSSIVLYLIGGETTSWRANTDGIIMQLKHFCLEGTLRIIFKVLQHFYDSSLGPLKLLKLNIL